MYSRIVKCSCLAALILASVVALHGISEILVQFVICGGALFVMMEGVRNRQYIWVAAFVVPIIFFNPLIPIELSGSAALSIALLCVSAFLLSLRYLSPKPRMSLATITDLPERGESL